MRLFRKKKFGHQLLKSPMRVWFASGCVALLHTAIPYVIRGITGVLCEPVSSSAIERDGFKMWTPKFIKYYHRWSEISFALRAAEVSEIVEPHASIKCVD